MSKIPSTLLTIYQHQNLPTFK